jgi:hypothetical protein
MKRAVGLDVIEIVDRLNAIKRKAAVIGATMEGYENQPDAGNGIIDLCADIRDEIQGVAEEKGLTVAA